VVVGAGVVFGVWADALTVKREMTANVEQRAVSFIRGFIRMETLPPISPWEKTMKRFGLEDR